MMRTGAAASAEINGLLSEKYPGMAAAMLARTATQKRMQRKGPVIASHGTILRVWRTLAVWNRFAERVNRALRHG
jgi:hypothetical protein